MPTDLNNVGDMLKTPYYGGPMFRPTELPNTNPSIYDRMGTVDPHTPKGPNPFGPGGFWNVKHQRWDPNRPTQDTSGGLFSHIINNVSSGVNKTVGKVAQNTYG